MANKSKSDTVTIEQSSCKTTPPHVNEPQYARSDITADSEAPSYSSRLDNSKYGKSPINKKEKMSPYQFFRQHYTKFSTSFMLENKAATARDHLGKCYWGRLF
jgi:hypothetical protein